MSSRAKRASQVLKGSGSSSVRGIGRLKEKASEKMKAGKKRMSKKMNVMRTSLRAAEGTTPKSSSILDMLGVTDADVVREMREMVFNSRSPFAEHTLILLGKFAKAERGIHIGGGAPKTQLLCCTLSPASASALVVNLHHVTLNAENLEFKLKSSI